MRTEMISMTAKVMKYWASRTAKVYAGRTKKKSNSSTLRTEAKMPGPRPSRTATNATPRKKTMTWLASESPGQRHRRSPARPVQAAVTRAARA